MKTTSRLTALVTSFVVAVVVTTTVKAQTTLYWSFDGNTLGGTGTWDTTNNRFGTSTTPPFPIVWDNTTNASDTAQFQGTAGTVTVDPSVTAVRRLNIQTTGYTINGGTVTSNQTGNGIWLQSNQTGTATVNLGATFSVTGNTNIRIQTNSASNTQVLNVGGNYQFSDNTATKRLDLETSIASNSNTHTINFTGSLLNNGGDTRLRIGQSGGQAATFNISGASTHTGGAEIKRGTVNLSNASGFGTGNIRFSGDIANTDSRLNVVGGINLSNVIDIQGTALNVTTTIGKDASDNTTSTLSGNLNLQSDTNTLTFDIANADGLINVSGLISDGAGTRGFTKSGAGTLQLSNSGGNSYDGATNVTGGTLLVTNSTGSATGTGAVTIASGATLAGNGRIGGAVTVSGSVAPGNSSIDTLRVNNDVTWNAGNSWRFELGAAGSSITSPGTSDLLLITGGNDFLKGTGSSFTFDFLGTGSVGWYRLVDWGTGTTTFSLSDFVATNLPALHVGTFHFDTATSGLYLEVTLIPEPSLIGLAALVLAILVAMRRRKLFTPRQDAIA